MKPLRSKDEILAYAADHAPSKACARAIQAGAAKVIPFPVIRGWNVIVTSESGKVWWIEIKCNEETRRYAVRYYEPTTCKNEDQ